MKPESKLDELLNTKVEVNVDKLPKIPLFMIPIFNVFGKARFIVLGGEKDATSLEKLLKTKPNSPIK